MKNSDEFLGKAVRGMCVSGGITAEMAEEIIASRLLVAAMLPELVAIGPLSAAVVAAIGAYKKATE